jgi:AhpD family alkylhydroperoxidase
MTQTISEFALHTLETAPEGAAPALQQVHSAYGFVPNILGVMADAPSLLKGYLTLSKIFSESSLTPQEQQVVLLTASRFNGCGYCMAAHTTSALRAGLSRDGIDAILRHESLEDARLEILRAFTANVLETRGFPSEAHLSHFLQAGYLRSQALEVILGIGLKTLSNYTNHLAQPPTDAAFREAWEG